MKLLILLSTLFLVLNSSFGQVDKKLKKLLYFQVEQLEATDNYKNVPEGDLIYYPSLTKKGDTTGVSNKGEFLMFHDDIVSKKGELFKLFRLNWVTNSEYEFFVKWVLDSTMLEKIYLNNNPTGNDEIDEYTISEMLIHPDVYYDEANDQLQEFDPSQPLINRELFPLSWTMKGIRDNQSIPLISDLYLTPKERFNKNKDWDERKLFYAENRDEDAILITPDRDVWALQSEHPFDIYYNFANYYSNGGGTDYEPVVGVSGTQMEAFLDFRTKRLQKELDEKGFNYTVHLSLPTLEEIALGDTADCDCDMIYQLPEIDMTEQWQITNEEYWEFMRSVQDSIILEAIYLNSDPTGNSEIPQEDLAQLLMYPGVYYDETNLSWTEFDIGQPFVNRELFPLDRNINWKKFIEPRQFVPLIAQYFQDTLDVVDAKGNIKYKDFKPRSFIYSYSWQDLKRSAQAGELKWDEASQQYLTTDSWEGKDLIMDRSNLAENKNGIRRHSDISKFFVKETVFLYPSANCVLCNVNCLHDHGIEKKSTCGRCDQGWEKNIKPYDFWSNPEALVTGLTYDQALAYYNWRHENKAWVQKRNARFFDELVPTEEQFKKVQAGESIILEKQELDYPNPLFRYVIHFYPKG